MDLTKILSVWSICWIYGHVLTFVFLHFDFRFSEMRMRFTRRISQTGLESGTISYRFCSHENGTAWYPVRYRIVPISGSLFRTAQFLDLFWNGPIDFFRTRVNATRLRTTFWNGPKWNGTISYPCEQGLNHLSLDSIGLGHPHLFELEVQQTFRISKTCTKNFRSLLLFNRSRLQNTQTSQSNA